MGSKPTTAKYFYAYCRLWGSLTRPFVLHSTIIMRRLCRVQCLLAWHNVQLRTASHCSTMFSADENVDMLLIYGETRQNAQAAMHLYQERFPHRRQPVANTVRSAERSFRTTASLSRTVHVRVSPVMSGVTAEVVLDPFRVNPHTSTRAIAQQSNISQSPVVRILHANVFHPYHMQLHQELHGRDFESRVDFCTWILVQVANNAAFVSHILFSDESRFHNNGSVNRHNMHYWSAENPHWVRQAAFQVRWGVNVWCGILGEHLIGPHFFEEPLTGARYL